MSVNYLKAGNDEGATFGRSASDEIGFYGLTTPIVKQTLTQAIVAGSSLAHIIRGVIELSNALQNLGLITTV